MVINNFFPVIIVLPVTLGGIDMRLVSAAWQGIIGFYGIDVFTVCFFTGLCCLVVSSRISSEKFPVEYRALRYGGFFYMTAGTILQILKGLFS